MLSNTLLLKLVFTHKAGPSVDPNILKVVIQQADNWRNLLNQYSLCSFFKSLFEYDIVWR